MKLALKILFLKLINFLNEIFTEDTKKMSLIIRWQNFTRNKKRFVICVYVVRKRTNVPNHYLIFNDFENVLTKLHHYFKPSMKLKRQTASFIIISRAAELRSFFFGVLFSALINLRKRSDESSFNGNLRTAFNGG